MFLIEKGKTPRVQCGLCAKLCAARLKRQQKYGMLCDLCIDALISETMQKYMALARSGVPKAERWVEMRNDDLVISISTSDGIEGSKLYEVWRARDRVFRPEPQVSLRLAVPNSGGQTAV